jgi:translocation and assembly module TamA
LNSRFRVREAKAWRSVMLIALCLLPVSAVTAAAGVDYEVVVEAKDEALSKLLYGEASLVLEAEPPATFGGVRRRARADEKLFHSLLRSRGYYASTVRWSIQEPGQDVEGVAMVRFTVEPGRLYRIQDVTILGLPPEGLALATDQGLTRLGLRNNAAAAASPVIGAQKKLIGELTKLGYPFAAIADTDIVVDHGLGKMTIVVSVDPGPRARFGDVVITGDSRIDAKFIARRLTIERDAVYDPSVVDESRRKLIDAGVFASVSITHADALAPDGSLPMRVAVAENKARTVGAGVLYNANLGVGLRAFWEHRNILGAAEKLRVEGAANQLGFSALVSFSEPDFLRPSQSLLLEFSAAAEDTDAYRSDSIRAGAGVERPLGELLVGGLGVSFEQAKVTGSGQDDSFTLIGFPGSARYDTTDDLLNATRGQRLSLSATPYIDPLDTRVSFLSLRLSERVYHRLGKDDRYVLAGRFAVGSIQGASRSNIPLTKRFFAGGADSVRGYQYQLAGPLDDENNPVGGLSTVQLGAEFRWKFSETLGIVPFVEAANVYDDAFPDFGGDFFWSAGLGARYYTVAGPLRVDLAFPINGRSGVDNVFEVYISLGQAF